MKNILNKKRLAAGLAIFLASSQTAFALTAEEANGYRDSMIGDIGLVGGVMIAAAFAAVAFKWVKAAVFG